MPKNKRSQINVHLGFGRICDHLKILRTTSELLPKIYDKIFTSFPILVIYLRRYDQLKFLETNYEYLPTIGDLMQILSLNNFGD